jgi:hypothetical protein
MTFSLVPRMTARHTSLGEKATIRATIGPATAVTEKHALVTMIAMVAAIHLGMQLTIHAVAAKLTYLNPTVLG